MKEHEAAAQQAQSQLKDATDRMARREQQELLKVSVSRWVTVVCAPGESWGVGVRVWSVGFRVQGSGFWVESLSRWVTVVCAPGESWGVGFRL